MSYDDGGILHSSMKVENTTQRPIAVLNARQLLLLHILRIEHGRWELPDDDPFDFSEWIDPK